MRYPSLDHYRKRQHRRRWITSAAAVLLIAAFSWADHHGYLFYRSDRIRYHGRTFTVARVVDGDTFLIDAPDGDEPTTRVRLWGIDTPELARGESPGPPRDAEPFAAEAKVMLAQLCDGKPVTLHLESHRERDTYDRLLAHVQLPDGSYANEQLLVVGLARYDRRWSHSRIERHELLERQARRDAVGVWAKMKK